MKELSVEEKAKRYDEALEMAKKLIENEETNVPVFYVNNIKDIFPELKESEDERIKQELIEYHKTQAFLDGKPNNKHVKFVAWLEKKGEQKDAFPIPTRENILAIWDLGNEWKELTNGCISTEHGTQLDYIQKHWHESEYYLKEKQGEQKDN